MMLTFLQDELLGLRKRWPRVLALLTCLSMLLVVAQQQQAMDAQASLISTLAADSNHLHAMQAHAKPKKDSIYITDLKVVEPKVTVEQKPATPEPSEPKPARDMKQI